MRKGQISFDFMIAVMAALIFVAALQGISARVQESQSAISIRNQESEIAYSISEIISSSAAFSDGTFSVEYKIPYLRVFGKEGLQTCEISIDSDSITVTYIEEEGAVTQTIGISIPAGVTVPNSTYCGSTLMISGGL